MMNWPTEVEVLDVTPRDGLQDAAGELSTDDKVTFIRRLAHAGVRRIEVTSFVSPKWIPRMRDAEEVISALGKRTGLIALVPNTVGFERATRCDVSEVTYVVSASPKHQMANLRMTLDDSWSNLRNIVKLRGDRNIRIRGAISCAFGSPFVEEEITAKHVAEIARTFKLIGADEIGLADTVGVGTPQVVSKITESVQEAVPNMPLALHLHDRYQLGQANVVAALLCGVTTIETSLGGLGGCPFAPNAPGNLDTELLVQWMKQMGIRTGVNLEELADIRKDLLEQLNRTPAR